MPPEFLIAIVIFSYGIVIGSFLNVCIYRIPLQESTAKARSHCMACGTGLKWYELIPVFSYAALRGKCRTCKSSISIQYPVVELVNGILYLMIFWVNGMNAVSVLYCFLTSALIVLSVIDFRTYEIPFGINVFILALGLIRLALDYSNWSEYAIGLLVVSGFLYLIYIVTKGRGIGGGDVKLMAACGLLLGWKLIILAFFLGCILGSVIHLIRMRLSDEDHVLAMGPYLSAGVFVAALWGRQLTEWYFTLL
ncbi:prepilin peptidase [Anaerobium acetethylicum]|uniref:Leader peptidase (Prepilin peptidase) / N-methyltransferase n=1 Tax=Anaerobium acetethylicum TaxID=1619234 RepID=A0A1D3TN36_9FIRM|nr:A24 family peptidase [Anaerobium acetethylicum]SCP94728.1 leader peptidase (prepilin peptidase) / N-methyltransferase [Anaerobium acetethylicum]